MNDDNHGITRRELLVSTAVLGAGAVVATASFGQERGTLTIRVDDMEALAGARGEEMRRLLQQHLRIDARGLEREVPVLLIGVYVERGRARETFMSSEFRARPGALIESAGGAYPPQAFIPGHVFLPGDMLLPDDMLYPPRSVEEFAARSAMEAMRAQRIANGLFFVVVAADPRMRGALSSRGTLIPTASGR